MFGYDWEFISVLAGAVAFILGCLWYLARVFWGWRSDSIRSKQEKMVAELLKEQLKPLLLRISTLENDVKNTALANVQMSQTMHSQINKILLTFAGRDHE